MRQVFKPTLKYWLTEDGFGLILSPVILLAAWWLDHRGLLIGSLVVVLISLPGIYKLLRVRLAVDEEGISFQEKNTVTSVRWPEVIWIKVVESSLKPRKVLEIGISQDETEDFFQFTLDYFDQEQVWQLIQHFAPPAALAKDAYRQTSCYMEWADEEAKIIAEMKTPLQVSDSWLGRIGAWFMVLIGLSIFGFIFFDDGWRREDDSYVPLVFLILMGLFMSGIGLAAALTSGTTEFSHEGITRKTLLHRVQMRWDQITHIEESPNEYIAYSSDKYLKFYTSGWWAGRNKWDAAHFFLTKVELHQIEVKPMKARLFFRKSNKAG